MGVTHSQHLGCQNGLLVTSLLLLCTKTTFFLLVQKKSKLGTKKANYFFLPTCTKKLLVQKKANYNFSYLYKKKQTTIFPTYAKKSKLQFFLPSASPEESILQTRKFFYSYKKSKRKNFESSKIGGRDLTSCTFPPLVSHVTTPYTLSSLTSGFEKRPGGPLRIWTSKNPTKSGNWRVPK